MVVLLTCVVQCREERPIVMPGLVPGIQVFCPFKRRRGWHRNSGLPELVLFLAGIAHWFVAKA
jgi:hypothetical protein